MAAADIHGMVEVYEWIARMVRENGADLLILAGDLFTYGSVEEQREQGRQIIPLLQGAGTPCFYIMGNDDNVGLEYEDEQIKPLHGRRLTFRGQRFVGYQYTPRSWVGDVFVKAEDEIEKDLRAMEPLFDRHCVLVTHAPARGALDRTATGEHAGSASVAAFFDRSPVLAHIHGHMHESFGCDSYDFNVASAGQKRAFLIDLPSLEHTVLQEASDSKIGTAWHF